ncbi:PREDICTED: 23 kDa integral membrane protein-like [Elephantulus edwardii]|uniref:23 kDa integral membrane protein-like n=1 Tax=Elephantulus edwardii TaxID=28737 RepID=UPI0003F0CC15|nr:PREDICTED: 23 kDa integral membrane protein-like [Elephantulus edwardii]
MAVEGGMKCVKFLLYVFLLAFCACAVGLIAVGVGAQVLLSQIKQGPTPGSLLPVVIIAVGAFLFLVALVGCCGTCKENYCLMITFVIFLSLIMLVEIIGDQNAKTENNEEEMVIANGASGNPLQYLDTDTDRQPLGCVVLELKVYVILMTAENYRAPCPQENDPSIKGSQFFICTMGTSWTTNVKEGMEVMKKKSFSSRSRKTSKKIVIMDHGQLK